MDEELPQQLLLIAENELNEVPNRRKDDIAALKEWLKFQPHLHTRTEDRWLLTFLRSCKFSIEKTKEKLDRFYTVRTNATSLFDMRDPYLPDIQALFDDNVAFILPVVIGEPIRIISRMGTVPPEIVTAQTRMKVMSMVLDLLLEEYAEVPIAGVVWLHDCKGITYGHMAQVTLPFVRKCVMCFAYSYPIRVKKVHLINLPPVAMALKSLLESLLPQKIKSIFHFHVDNGGEEIYKNLPRHLVPPEYGGDGKSMSELTEELKHKLESYKDWFVNDKKYFCDETKRPNNSPVTNELFGLDGSFQKLELD